MASINDLVSVAIATSSLAEQQQQQQQQQAAEGSNSAALHADGPIASTPAASGGGGGAMDVDMPPVPAQAPAQAAQARAQASPPRPPPQQQETGKPVPVRGALIVLEGLDRSGKTTQVKLLQQRFVEFGRRVRVLRFPDRSTPIGQMIDAYLKSQVEMEDHVIHLLFSANRWEAVKSIATLLSEGTTVICDRYYYSGIVYSAAKGNPSLPLPWARAPEVGLPRPDIVLFLDLDEDQARARGGWGGEVYEKGEMQRRVRELFWGLSMGRVPAVPVVAAGGEVAAVAAAAAEPGLGLLGPGPPGPGRGDELRFREEEEDLQVVDASAGVEEVSEAIWKVVRPRFEAVERGEVGRVVRRVT